MGQIGEERQSPASYSILTYLFLCFVLENIFLFVLKHIF